MIEILIIILMVVLIINTCVCIYVYCIDLSNKRFVANMQESVVSSQKAFLEKENRLVKTLDVRNEEYKQLIIRYNTLYAKYKDLEDAYNNLQDAGNKENQ